MITITEGFFIDNVELDELRRCTNFVKKDLTCQMITGSFENGVPHGICSTALNNGFTCVGYYKNGFLTNFGKFRKGGGCSYIGEMHEGNAHGKGILT